MSERPEASASGSLRATDLAGLELPLDPSELPEEIRDRLISRARQSPRRKLSIGRYVILGELGRGGMGVVYDAWDPRIEREVAIKTVEPDLVPDEQEREEVIERFLREIKVVGKLAHPSIVTMYDYGEEPELRRGDDPYAPGRTYFYVMEYLHGQSLSRIMRSRGIIPDVEAVRIAIDVADALAVAHTRGIIHRDIKPSNIFIRNDGKAVLLDFGIAKTSSPGLTRQGQILGTPSYLAPERLREKEVPLDGRADLFSLGVLLYTMIVGRAPFEGTDVYDLIENIAKREHAKLARDGQAGRDLSRAIDRMLAKSPKDRYRDAGEAVAALRAVEARLSGDSDLPLGIPDGATEVAPPNLPMSVTEANAGLPVAGTVPEQSLNRQTRQIDMATEMGAIWETEEPPEISGSDVALIEEHETEPPPPMLGIPSRASVPPPSAVAVPAVRRVVDVSDEDLTPAPPTDTGSAQPVAVSRLTDHDETLADPERSLGAKLPPSRVSDAHAEAKTDSAAVAARLPVRVPAHSELPTEQVATELASAQSPLSVVRGSRIEASLVDEDDVVVRPAALGDVPDEMPTQTAYANGEPLQTEIVRPRRLQTGERADAVDDARNRAVRRAQSGVGRGPGAVVAVRSSSGVKLPSDASAAVARRTIGVRSGPRRASSTGGRRNRVGEIKVTATNLDAIGKTTDAQRIFRKRVAVFAGAALMAVAGGILLGRSAKPDPSTAIAPIVAEPPTRALGVVAGRAPQEQPELVVPRSAKDLLEEARLAMGTRDYNGAIELFKKASEATRSPSLAAEAHLGRALALRAVGSRRADDFLRLTVKTSPSSEAAAKARALLGEGGATEGRPSPARPNPAPRREARPTTEASTAKRDAPAPTGEPPQVLDQAKTDDPEQRCRQAAALRFSDPRKAVEALEGLKSTLRHPCVYFQLGGAYELVGDRSKALDAYRTYLRVNPSARNKDAVQKKIAKLGESS